MRVGQPLAFLVGSALAVLLVVGWVQSGAHGDDITGPSIGTPTYARSVSSNEPIIVTARISDQTAGNHGVLSTTLHYGYTAPYNQSAVSGAGPGSNGDGIWAFLIPAQGSAHNDRGLYFSIEACDNDDTPACSVNDNGGNYFAVDIHCFGCHPCLPLALCNWEYLPPPIMPNDTYDAVYQWNLPHVRAPYAWAGSTGSSDMIVAVLDTGADMGHPDLQGKFVAGFDFVHNDTDPSDDEGHGTHVTGILAAYSETGNYIDVTAPGGSPISDWDFDLRHWILSTYWRGAGYGEYVWYAGTSMAAPHVSGLVALVWSVNPALSNDQVEQIIEETAVDVGTPGRDDIFGYGRIDAYRALARASYGALAAEPERKQASLSPVDTPLSPVSRVPVQGTEPMRDEFASGAVLVKFKAGVHQEAISAMLGRYSVHVTRRIPALGVLVLNVPAGAELGTSEELSQNPAVEYAEPDYLVQALRVQ